MLRCRQSVFGKGPGACRRPTPACVSPVLQSRVVARCQPSAQELPKDDLGELAEKIEEISKSVDEGLQGTSLCLVGMMGSGKSTTGQMIANVLRYCFFDTDEVIEQAAGGQSIAEIFSSVGEDKFRDIETNVLRELSQYKNCVIATGGGAVMRPENWSSMNNAVTVYLKGPPELLAKRISSKDGTASRPLLAEAAPGEQQEAQVSDKLTKLLESRRKFYESADCTVSIQGDSELGASNAQMTYRVLLSTDTKIKDSAAEREARKNFVIKDSGPIPVGTKTSQPTGQQAEE